MWLAIGSGQIQRSLIVNWYRRCRLRPTLVSGLLISSRGRNFVFKALRFEIGLRSCTTTTTAVTTTTRPRSSFAREENMGKETENLKIRRHRYVRRSDTISRTYLGKERGIHLQIKIIARQIYFECTAKLTCALLAAIGGRDQIFIGPSIDLQTQGSIRVFTPTPVP